MNIFFKARKYAIRIIGILVFSLLFRGGVFAAPADQATFYIVEASDTWQMIAIRHGLSTDDLWRTNGVVNPTLLTAGQRLFLPSMTSSPITDNLILFENSDSLWKIALRNNNTLAKLLTLNGLDTPLEATWISAYTIQSETTSVAEAPSPEATVTLLPPTSDPTPVAAEPTLVIPAGENAIRKSRMGIQGHFSVPDDDRETLLDMSKRAGFTWIKYQVNWSLIEYSPGLYSVELEKLDQFMQSATARNYNILLSVVKAPDWARENTEEDGPPVDYGAYNAFLAFIIQRYGYRIAAIEVWNEPNLRREWQGGTLSGHEYMGLLSGAYQTIKANRSEITVISAGLAPTGINDGIKATDDRVYLRQMYESGLANSTDVVGIHPYGWANPPWIRCCNHPDGPPTHNNHPSFFFLNTIEDYRAIQTEFGDEGHQLWATEFGWGTMEGLGFNTPPDALFFDYVTQDLQARYIVEAYRITQEWDFMGPLFLWNLNVATLDGFDHNQAGYSILINLSQPRPAYTLLRETEKIKDN